MDISHGPDSKAAEHVALNVDVADEVDVSRGEINVSLDIQHRFDLKAAAGEFHVSRHGGDEGESVLADLGVPPLGQRYRFAALGGDLLIQHGPSGIALGGPDQPADLLPQLDVADQIQIGVVHLAVFIHLQDALYGPGKVVHNIAVLTVKGGLSPGNQEQMEVPLLVMGQPVHQPLVHAVRDTLVQHSPQEKLAVQLLA